MLVPCSVLALIINHEFSVMEILWTFSIYLESVALIPQLVFIHRAGKAEVTISVYLFVLGFYRGFYILNWVYRYNYEGFYDEIAIWAGCVQTILYLGTAVKSVLESQDQQLRELLRLTDPFAEEVKALEESDKTGKEKEIKEDLEFGKA